MGGSLTVHVLDEDQEPVEGIEVTCIFVGSFLGIVDTNSTDYTDDQGIAYFEDVPIGLTRAFAGGEEVDVEIGEGEYEDITITI